jgi:hypothetical protein
MSSRRAVGAQKPFKMIIANLRGGGDPSKGASGNPVTIRKTYEQQMFIDLPGRGQDGVSDQGKTPGTATRSGGLLSTAAPAGGTGTITVDSNTFTGPTDIHLGKYTLTSGDDFDIGVSVAATATNLAAAIDVLPEFSAPVPGGAVVTVTGPVGPGGNNVMFHSGGFSPGNLLFSPGGGTLSGAEPSVGPPSIS